MKLLIRMRIGLSGWKGRSRAAPSTENMLPKLDEAPMRMYFSMLQKMRRPSSMPSTSTRSDFSSRTASADSLATSTAVSTEMPTSAALSASTSLMPSPMKPTVWPWAFNERMTCSFWAGVRRARMSASIAALSKASLSIAASCVPVTTRVTGMPTSWQTLRETSSLSPVRILARTPRSRRPARAVAAVSLGGSKKAR